MYKSVVFWFFSDRSYNYFIAACIWSIVCYFLFDTAMLNYPSWLRVFYFVLLIMVFTFAKPLLVKKWGVISFWDWFSSYILPVLLLGGLYYYVLVVSPFLLCSYVVSKYEPIVTRICDIDSYSSRSPAVDIDFEGGKERVPVSRRTVNKLENGKLSDYKLYVRMKEGFWGAYMIESVELIKYY